ncbi:hypothetical protein CN966_30495 [Bacillus cereus]|nr:hypothetical protein IC7_02983 [Bacillus cereus BAG1O-1]PGN48201.1 hypothetical protein CN966_30495 [Bacillus cereus]
MDNPNKDKTCFIITPIGDGKSDIRRAADGVIDAVIVPALIEIGFQEENIKVAHRMANPGSINKQVITSILQSDIAIANLTTLNPNVMYELAIRHAVRKPVIQICQEGTRLPFDITEERTIFYTNDMAGVLELNDNFRNMVVQAIEDEEPDNPIYRVIEANTIMKNVDEDDPSRFLLNRMNSLENNLSNLINSLNHVPSQTNYSERKGRQIGLMEMRQAFRFELDKSKINTREFNELIMEYSFENPDIDFKVAFFEGKAEVRMYSSNVLIINKALEFILSQEGVTHIRSKRGKLIQETNTESIVQ